MFNRLPKHDYIPMYSAGLFCRALIKLSKLSLMALINCSFLVKHTKIMLSILSLKSENVKYALLKVTSKY